jgi:uncharacterized protein (TIGR03435 family)
MADQLVVNKTGLQGSVDFHLEFSVDPNAPRSITALQEQLGAVLEKQTGLKLRPAKGQSNDFLSLDHIERLSVPVRDSPAHRP